MRILWKNVTALSKERSDAKPESVRYRPHLVLGNHADYRNYVECKNEDNADKNVLH